MGANDGSSCLHLQNKNSKIFAFEPTPYLLNKYLYQYQNENYVVIDKAVSNFNGKAAFKIAGQHDWGCSSLNTFNDNLSETWKCRTDFLVTEEIEVDVITLEKFIIDNDINTIDWLHIDTQGSDLNVLKGLKDKISIVVAGVIEAPADESVKLYKEQPSKEESIDFLIKNKFKVNSMEYQMNEYNIYFSRS